MNSPISMQRPHPMNAAQLTAFATAKMLDIMRAFRSRDASSERICNLFDRELATFPQNEWEAVDWKRIEPLAKTRLQWVAPLADGIARLRKQFEAKTGERVWKLYGSDEVVVRVGGTLYRTHSAFCQKTLGYELTGAWSPNAPRQSHIRNGADLVAWLKSLPWLEGKEYR